MNEIDADTGEILEKIDTWLDGLMKLLPNIAVAIGVLLFFIVLGVFLAKFAKRRAKKRDRPSLGEVGASLVKWGMILLGVMLAVTIVAPSVKPADILAGLGVGSVAIGFAFKDILQNMLAGILILLRQPFEIGDQIVSGGHEGTVEKIETRATFIKTYDGKRVVIPNSDIYTNSVVVNTAFDQIRSSYEIGIGCNDDWDKATKLMIEAAQTVEGVSDDPAPEVIPISYADSSNNFLLRWWTASDRSSVIHTHGRVLQVVYKALDENGIDLPYPTQVVLFHDQTEATDGDRAQQREGWPAGKSKLPKQARIFDAMQSKTPDRSE